MSVSFPRLGSFQLLFLESYFFPFLYLFSFWDLYNGNVSMFDVVPGVP